MTMNGTTHVDGGEIWDQEEQEAKSTKYQRNALIALAASIASLVIYAFTLVFYSQSQFADTLKQMESSEQIGDLSLFTFTVYNHLPISDLVSFAVILTFSVISLVFALKSNHEKTKIISYLAFVGLTIAIALVFTAYERATLSSAADAVLTGLGVEGEILDLDHRTLGGEQVYTVVPNEGESFDIVSSLFPQRGEIAVELLVPTDAITTEGDGN